MCFDAYNTVTTQLRSRTFELLPKNVPLQSFLRFGSGQPVICLLVLPLLELHINDIISYILFFWLCSFSIYLRFFHFVFITFLKNTVWLCHRLLFSFLVNMDFFWHQAVVNKGTLCMCLRTRFHLFRVNTLRCNYWIT